MTQLLRRKIFRSTRHSTHDIVTDENYSTSRGPRSAGLVRRIFGSGGFSAPWAQRCSSWFWLAEPAVRAAPLNWTQLTPRPTACVGHSPSRPFSAVRDVPAEPEAAPYFKRLLGNAYPGLDHYWREVSYGAISLAGSIVTGWHDLPHPQSDYLTGTPNLPVPTMESPVDLQRLAEDCVSAVGEASSRRSMSAST